VLVVAAEYLSDWVYDVHDKLFVTGAFETVDVFDALVGTPTLAQLEAYQAVLVFSDGGGFADTTTLGNNLASAVDAGVRVVTATFADTSILGPGGRWISGNYNLIALAGQAEPSVTSALQIVDPSSSLAAGVSSLTATSAYRSSGAVVNGGVTVIEWGDGAPLVVRGSKNGMPRVELNFFPPSSAVRASFWVGSGEIIMRNALEYLGD